MPESGKESNGNKTRNEKRKKQQWILIPLLLVFVSISSFLAGTRVGNSTDQRLGQMLDTIVLSPEEKHADENRIDFSGQMLYTDGTPCSNQKIELHSDPMQTVTDSEGFFYFKDVEIGDHRLSVLDENNNPVSQLSVQIKRDKSVTAGLVDNSADSCLFSVSDTVMQIHVKIKLDNEKGLLVEPEVYTRDEQGVCMDSKGQKVSPALLSQPGEEPLPSGENRTLEETETQPAQTEPSETARPSEASAPTLPETQPVTQAAPQESIQIPEPSSAAESTTSTADSGNHNGSDNEASGDSGGDSSSKPTQTDPAPTEHEPTNPAPTEPEPTLPETTPPEPTEPDPTEPSPTEPSPTEPLPTEPEESLDVTVQEKNGPVWSQQTAISLFADLTGEGGAQKLMPGSKGSYEFLVGNYNSYDITYTMQISAPKGQLLLPLRYRLKSEGRYLCGDSKNWLDAGELSTAAVTLPAGTEKEYLLEWQWMFEDGHDDLDTKIGSGQNLEYEVIVTIHIEQVTP